MDSRNKKVKKDFSYRLGELLNKANLSLRDFSKEINVSRQHLTLLKKRKSLPSTKLLHKICETLRERNIQDKYIIPLLYAGLDIQDENSEAMYEGFPFPFDYASEDKDLKSRCIITDILAECVYDEILEDTAKMLLREVEYYYFLPKESPDWQTMIYYAEKMNPAYGKRIRDNSYCIKCPSSFIYSRMRIDNINCLDPKPFISLGPTSCPTLHPLPLETTAKFISVLKNIIAQAKIARIQKESTLIYQGDGIMLKFELETNTVK